MSDRENKDTQSSSSAESGTGSLSVIRSAVKQDLKAIDEYMLHALDTNIPLIQAIGNHILQHGGKKLRPITLALSARALGYEGNQHIILAVMIEFIHVATLLHDDVVDQSIMRRGRASANSIWGNSASVLVGDFFYSRSFEMLTEVNRIPVFEVMAQATRRISEGEIMQLVQLQAANTTEEEYLSTIDRKTATLFRAGAHIGSIISDQPEEIQQQIADYGRNLGIAFQLIDDYLDYAGDTKTIGKKVGDDLSEGKLTLPLIYAREHVSEEDQQLINAALEHPGDCNIENICHIVAMSGALEYTSNLARHYGDQAVQCLDFLPQSLYRDLLIKLAEFSYSRNY